MQMQHKARLRRTALVALSLPVLLPLLWLLLAWFKPGESWAHLRAYVLPDAIKQTLLCAFGVYLLSGLIGATLGWIQARYEFPFRRLLDTLLLLPLALPGFIVAYVWIGAGQKLGLQVQGVMWAILIYSSCLFPYVFALVRSSAQNISASLSDSAKLIGMSRWQCLRQLYLPLLLPAVRLGVLLVLMETLADFGAANLLGLQTLTTSVYKTWFSLQDLTSATQLASLCAMIMLGLLLLENALLHKRTDESRSARKLARETAKGWRRIALPAFGFTVVAFSLVLPVSQLGIWAIGAGISSWSNWFGSLQNSLVLGAIASAIIVAFGMAFALLERQYLRDPRIKKWTQFYGLGYGIAGTILAVAILLCASAFGWIGQWLIASPALLLIAYWARFARLGASPFSERLGQLSPNLSDAARMSGLNAFARFGKLYLPVLTPVSASALLLVFVEILKELPATLVLRPIGWDTLSVKIYGYTSEGLWQLAAAPSLVLVLVSALVIVLLRKQTVC